MGGQRYVLAAFPGKEAPYPLYNVGKLNKIGVKKKVPFRRSLALLALSYRTFH